MPRSGELIRAGDFSRVAYVTEAADSSTITTSETVVGTMTFTQVSGGIYSTEWHLKVVQSVAGDYFLFSVREDSVSGTVLDTWAFTTGTTSYGLMFSYYIDYTAAASGGKTIVGTLVRGSGTGNVTRSAKSNYQIYRVA